MWDYMIEFIKSFFVISGLAWNYALVSIGLAFAFGAAWFTAYWTPILKKPWVWALFVVSALLTLLAVTFVQIPLQWWSQEAMVNLWGYTTFWDWLPLTGIPLVLLSGLVQEGAKLVPVVFYWQRKGMSITPRMGLVLGAVAGLGFGVFEAVWAHNIFFASYGLSWELAVFWERFFTVAFHIAVSALAGYGLAKGWGWQFYLIASGLHALLNYSVILVAFGVFEIFGLEAYVAVGAALVAALALWLRWRKTAEPTLGGVIQT